VTQIDLDAARKTRAGLVFISDGSRGSDRLARVLANHDDLLREVERLREENHQLLERAEIAEETNRHLRTELADARDQGTSLGAMVSQVRRLADTEPLHLSDADVVSRYRRIHAVFAG